MTSGGGRRGWRESGIGLLDETGRLAVLLTVSGVSMAEVERVAGHVASALAELPDEPPAQPTRLHRAG
jgi:hypothetical protein